MVGDEGDWLNEFDENRLSVNWKQSDLFNSQFLLWGNNCRSVGYNSKFNHKEAVTKKEEEAEELGNATSSEVHHPTDTDMPSVIHTERQWRERQNMKEN